MKRPPATLRRPPPPEPPPAEVEGFVRGEVDADARGRSQVPADARGRLQAPADAHGRLRASKALVVREGGRERRKMTVYLRPETAAALAAHLALEGGEASLLVDRAVVEYLRAKGALP